MFWIIFGTIVFALAIAGLVYVYVRDRRYEKRSVVETMSRPLWDEIAQEREQNLEKAKKFREALENAKGR
jgi:LPS O-antigen subunit length determinant protein (WzzB/FepE family)